MCVRPRPCYTGRHRERAERANDRYGSFFHWTREHGAPMSIDRIPLPSTDGALWLCGRNDVGPDPEAAMAWAGASTIVCLNHIDELAIRFPDYVDWLRANMGERAIWYPIQNFRAPSARSVMPLGESPADAVRTVASHRVFAGPGSASQWALVEGVAALLADADPGQVHGH